MTGTPMEINRVSITIGQPRYDVVEITMFPRSGNAEVRHFFPSGEQQGPTEFSTIGQLVEVCEQIRVSRG